jgi:hypothetical protein
VALINRFFGMLGKGSICYNIKMAVLILFLKLKSSGHVQIICICFFDFSGKILVSKNVLNYSSWRG